MNFEISSKIKCKINLIDKTVLLYDIDTKALLNQEEVSLLLDDILYFLNGGEVRSCINCNHFEELISSNKQPTNAYWCTKFNERKYTNSCCFERKSDRKLLFYNVDNKFFIKYLCILDKYHLRKDIWNIYNIFVGIKVILEQNSIICVVEGDLCKNSLVIFQYDLSEYELLNSDSDLNLCKILQQNLSNEDVYYLISTYNTKENAEEYLKEMV
jgi:hypothetical protein